VGEKLQEKFPSFKKNRGSEKGKEKNSDFLKSIFFLKCY
jgi:hypothetical protein